MPKRPKRPRKTPKTYKVYVVYSVHANEFYVGMSSKTGHAYENYYGSGSQTDKWEDKVKVTLAELPMKSAAKLGEICLQLRFRRDPRCINDMLNIRCRGSFLSDFDEWPLIESLDTLIKLRLRDHDERTATTDVEDNQEGQPGGDVSIPA